MSTVGDPGADVEIARQRRRQRRRRRRRRESLAAGSETTTTTDGSRYFSDSGEDYPSWQSTSGSVPGGSLDECRFPEIERATGSRRQQKVGRETLTTSEDDVDLEMGELEMKVHAAKQKREERDCRICHLRLVGDVDDHDQERDVAIELGCCCKGDLGASHKQCAETWFKIRGNTVCEICGAIAVNVLSEQPNEPNTTVAASAQTAAVEPPTGMETNTFWHGRRVVNALLTCMVLAFVISWLFHYNMRPKN